MTIHPTAVIDSSAEVHESAEIGAYAVIGANVSIGPETRVDAHAVIAGPCRIGARNQIGAFASIGAPPQDLNYQGEPTELIIGDDNLIREYVSIHRGTVKGRGKTVIGSRNMLMAYAHVAHDCIVGDHVIMANVATLGGHVELGDRVSLGGLVAVHQNCRIGELTHVGGLSGINLDVPPYVILTGTRNQMRITGLNKIGLRRAGMNRETIRRLDDAFRQIFRSGMLLRDALDEVRLEMEGCPEVERLVCFFDESKRGVVKRTADD